MRTINAETAFQRGLKTDDGKRVIPIRPPPDLTARALEQVAVAVSELKAEMKASKPDNSAVVSGLARISEQVAQIAKMLVAAKVEREDKPPPITGITIESRDYSGRATKFIIEREEDYG